MIHLQPRKPFETWEIDTDQTLFNQILATADSLEEDLRSDKLQSLGSRLRGEVGPRSKAHRERWRPDPP